MLWFGNEEESQETVVSSKDINENYSETAIKKNIIRYNEFLGKS